MSSDTSDSYQFMFYTDVVDGHISPVFSSSSVSGLFVLSISDGSLSDPKR